MKYKKISVVVATYNEKDNIAELIKQIVNYSGQDLFEIIIVDDNSPDGTWKIVKNLQKKYKNLSLLLRKNKKGLPSALWDGIKKSRGNIVVWLDSDLTQHPRTIPKLLSYIPEYDVVIASRYIKGGNDGRSSIMRVGGSALVNILAYVLLGRKVKDYTSGFYAAKKEVFSKIKLITRGYVEYCIKFPYDAIKKGFKVKEVCYTLTDRQKGYSKTDESLGKFLYNGYLCGKEIVKLRLGK